MHVVFYLDHPNSKKQTYFNHIMSGNRVFAVLFTLGFIGLGAMGVFRVVVNNGQDIKMYCVKLGNHDFKPNDFPLPLAGINNYSAYVSFDSTCWWSIEDEDYPHGTDIFDWNKIGGFTNYFSANNRQSVLYAWRPDKTYNRIQVTPYVNDKKGGFIAGDPMSVPVDSVVWLFAHWEGNLVTYEYGGGIWEHNIRKPWMLRKVGPWFGGNQAAHNDMKLSMKVLVK